MNKLFALYVSINPMLICVL